MFCVVKLAYLTQIEVTAQENMKKRKIQMKKVKTSGFNKGMIPFYHDCLVTECHLAWAPVCDCREEGWHESFHASWARRKSSTNEL